MDSPETVDVVIVGAGLSGINSAYRVKTQLPHHSYTVLEGRHEIGGTWSFWKYPGLRTDSSMGVFGFSWRPWQHDLNMAPGAAIKSYLKECAAAEGIDKKIRFQHRVVATNWRSDEQRWTLRIEVTQDDGSIKEKIIKAWWIINASGYYSYEKPQQVVIPGIDQFAGEVVHPQSWHDTVDHANKKIIVIGSGATAITLLPTLAKTAASVTMLQRTPSYVFNLPGKDKTVAFLSRFMPIAWAAYIQWWKALMAETLFVSFLLAFPSAGKRIIKKDMRKQLPPGFDIDKHFNPWYNPFEQRLCFCPSGDFFKALSDPNSNARIVTDTIDTVTPSGIRLNSGETLEADMIVTATGLYFSVLAGVSCTVDGVSVTDSLGDRFTWNGCMLEGMPNAGLITGYTAATWTPGADVRVRQLIKVIRHMDKTGATSGTPTVDPVERAEMKPLPAVGLSSTYLTSAWDRMPKVGTKRPWVNGANWATDMWRFLWSDVNLGMKFTFGEKKKDL
ncbi:hypothetical protein B0J18DRAFT_414769 [Chaetomium sp. MPI-SDFR-AT-0129]|nr:hypothetical protein B0J18DRAFT_414769 [Chaetomium sp. MPI-SDFR-AT-0129]